MTLYQIGSVRGEKIEAFSILIKKSQIMAWDFPYEYDNNIPEKAFPLPRDTRIKVKQQLADFSAKALELISKNTEDGDINIEVGKRYYSGRSINSVTKTENGRVYYNAFRIDPENISPCWAGDERIEWAKEDWLPITEELYETLLSRYKTLVATLQKQLFTLAQSYSTATHVRQS